MARIPSLRQSEQQMTALEQRASALSHQLSQIAVSCREIFDSMEAIERQWQRLPSAENLQECASAAREMARAVHDAR